MPMSQSIEVLAMLQEQHKPVIPKENHLNYYTIERVTLASFYETVPLCKKTVRNKSVMAILWELKVTMT